MFLLVASESNLLPPPVFRFSFILFLHPFPSSSSSSPSYPTSPYPFSPYPFSPSSSSSHGCFPFQSYPPHNLALGSSSLGINEGSHFLPVHPLYLPNVRETADWYFEYLLVMLSSGTVEVMSATLANLCLVRGEAADCEMFPSFSERFNCSFIDAESFLASLCLVRGEVAERRAG